MTNTTPPRSLAREIPRLVLVAIGVMAILVVLHVLYMVVYGHLLNPGQPAEHYPAHAQASGPWFSTVVGAPLFIFAGRRLARRAGRRGLVEAMLMCTIYIAIDVGFLIGAGAAFQWVFGLAMVTKVVATFAGARSLG
jgi:hypothetical protein